MTSILRFAVLALAATTLLADPDHRKQKPMVRVTFRGYQISDSALTGKHIDPTLEIYKDGFVRVLRLNGDEATKWVADPEKMERLRALMKAVDWSKLTTKKIDEAVYKAMSDRGRGGFIISTHDSTVFIEIRDGPLNRDISFRGIDWMPKDYPEVTELQTLNHILEQVYLSAGEGLDGEAAPPVGKRHLREQFVAVGARLGEAEPISSDEFHKRGRPFRFQLKELGDETFSTALAKEPPSVIAAVGAVLEPKDLTEFPRTRDLDWWCSQSRVPSSAIDRRRRERTQPAIYRMVQEAGMSLATYQWTGLL